MTAIRDFTAMDSYRQAHRFGALVQPHVGLIGTVRSLPLRLGELEVEVVGASLGDVAGAFPHIASDEPMSGAGNDLEFERAWIRAVVEAAERYATVTHVERDFEVASARELGTAALDLERLPRCSARELADPKCPLGLPTPDRPIRWVRGYSLVDRQERLVPAVMVHLGLAPWETERFWLQISTGVAAHTTPEAALAAAICEVVERDALALTWLGQLALPRFEALPPDSDDLQRVLDSAERSALRVHVFDATTDVGIPTALSIQLWDGHPYCDVTLSCATAIERARAYVKAVCEAVSARIAMDKPQEGPDEIEDFSRLTHGAHHFGRGGHRRQLDFLLAGEPLPPIDGEPIAGASERQRLDALVRRLGDMGMDVVAVDLTTDELRDVGLWAVRVIVPELMPISFVQRARFLGSPRLRDFVSWRTAEPFTEGDVNPRPLPFA